MQVAGSERRSAANGNRSAADDGSGASGLGGQARGGRRLEEHLKNWPKRQATLARQAAVVGWATACVLWVHLGDPAELPLCRGVSQGHGVEPQGTQQRALSGAVEDHQARAGRSAAVAVFCGDAIESRRRGRGWYEVKKADRPKGGNRALIAVMRKLALGLYVLGVREEPFDARRLFSAAVGKPSRRNEQGSRTRQKNGKRFNWGSAPDPGIFGGMARCPRA